MDEHFTVRAEVGFVLTWANHVLSVCIFINIIHNAVVLQEHTDEERGVDIDGSRDTLIILQLLLGLLIKSVCGRENPVCFELNSPIRPC